MYEFYYNPKTDEYECLCEEEIEIIENNEDFLLEEDD